jgi:hypothetical protein
MVPARSEIEKYSSLLFAYSSLGWATTLLGSAGNEGLRISIWPTPRRKGGQRDFGEVSPRANAGFQAAWRHTQPIRVALDLSLSLFDVSFLMLNASTDQPVERFGFSL